MSTAVTSGIKVSVQVAYRSEFSDPAHQHYMFSYRVRIENNSPYEVQLLSRKWHIHDSLGQYREVEGPGVVGKQPVLSPGESHEYESACNLVTPLGIMDGYYVMHRTSDQREFQVLIPRFYLETPFMLN